MLLHLCYTWFFFPLMYFSVPMPLLSVDSFSIFGGLMVILDISVYLTRFHPLMTLFRRWYCSPCFPPARLICPREEGNCLKSCLFSLTALPVDHVWTRSDLWMFQLQKNKQKKQIKSEKSVVKKVASVESVLPRAHSVIRMWSPISISTG